MKNTRLVEKRGFTLVELMVAVSIFTVFSAIMAVMFVSGLFFTATMTEKSFFIIERAMAVRTSDRDLSYGSTLVAGTAETFTIQATGTDDDTRDRVVVYSLVDDGDYINLVREEYLPADLLAPERTKVIVGSLRSAPGVEPEIAFVDEDGVAVVLTGAATLTPAEVAEVREVVILVDREYSRFRRTVSKSQEIRLYLYNPVAASS